MGTNARYIEVVATDMNMLAINPVLADPRMFSSYETGCPEPDDATE